MELQCNCCNTSCQEVLASLISKLTGSREKNFLLNSQHTLVFVYGNVHTLAGLESVWIIFYALGLSRTFRSWNNRILSY